MKRNTKNSSSPAVEKLPPLTRVKKAVPREVNLEEVDLDIMSEDCRNLYKLLSLKLDAIVENMKIKSERLEKCEGENRVLREKVAKLESKLDDVKSQHRNKNLIISGNLHSHITGDNVPQAFVQFLHRELRYELPPSNIVAAYRIGARLPGQSVDNRSVMLKLRDDETKKDVKSAFRSIKPPNVYSNEDLPPSRARLLCLLRQAKKISKGKLTGCGSLNGNVFAYIVPTDATGKSQKVFVRTVEKLESLCDVIGISFSALTDGLSDLW